MSAPVAFYAPLKSPDHPAPSGDRAMARLLLAALERAGFAPHLASTLRSFEPAGEPARQETIRAEATAEADRIVGLYRSGALPQPRLWFTYHCYYKAPDWIGPAVSRALGIPYVVAEGSRARKRETGPWALGHAGATAALDSAAMLFAMTEADTVALLRDRVRGQVVVPLPPFLDLADWPEPDLGAPRRDGPARLLAVAMMREGDKLASLRELADALGRLPGAGWRLTIAGDGPARPAVADAFAPFGARVALTPGVLGRPALARLYEEADLLVWPAINEAWGMALLEAQAMGCPVLAVRRGGVASVVQDGETGFLVGPDQAPAALAEALARLIGDLASLRPLRRRARAFVAGDRNLAGAAAILSAALHPLLVAEPVA